MASTQSTQIKVTLPDELYLLLKAKASKYGLNMASYLRYLAISDIRDQDLPTFPMSAKNEVNGFQALEDYKAGKTKSVTDIEKYFKNL